MAGAPPLGALDPVPDSVPDSVPGLDPVLAPAKPTLVPVKPVKPVTFRKFDDIDGQRAAIYGDALGALQGKSVENDQFRVEIHDPHFRGTYAPTLREEKQAILGGGSLEQKLYGTVRLIDKQTGQLVDEQQTVLAHVPHLNQRGLFVRDGSIWLGRNQQRLRSGIYGRTAQDGTVQAQVNAQRGRGFQVALEPKTGLFKLNVGQSTTRLYPLLRGLGVSDQDLEAQWGPELFKKNWRPISGNDHKELQKVVGKLGGPKDALLEVAQLAPRLTEILGNTELDDQVTTKTMGRPVRNLQPRDLLDITGKVLRISRGDEGPDNRDSQAYQSTHSSEDFIRERLDRDRSGGLRTLLWKATKDRSLKRLSSGLMTPNIDGLFQGSGLFVGTEDTNPLEIHDLRHGLIRTGDGGMSAGSVSRDARDVQTSYLGFIDGSRTPDSSNIGLDLRTTGAAVKGSDNRLYTPVRNTRTGQTEMKPAIDLEHSTVTFPGELARPGRMVRALSGGKLRYVPRAQVDWELPGVSSLLNPTTQVIPMPEGVKGQRLLMGSKMSSQAMPLEDPEAPLVQTADDQGGSVQHALGEVMGAVRAKQDGTVESVTPDEIVIRNQDGTRTVRQLFNHYTHSRKTMSHNDALVQAGDPVRAGQTLARSNYTDRDGTLALGKNLRVAYQFGKGKTFEDSWVISESAAKKLTSQHLYRQELGLDDIHTTKKGDYVAIYGGKFSQAQLKNLGDDGVISAGQTVQAGDPLVLGVARKAKRAIGAVMQSPGSGFTDRSEVWDHKAPGVVTDVVRSKDGIRVTVKSYAPTDIADKLSNRYGSKGVVAEILPDDQMPHDEQGRPVEMIMNAAGVVSRVNPSALAETLLAKVARKTGKPYLMKPFGVPGGLADFALNEAKRHGVKELETLTDPVTGRKLPDVMVGEQYMMKLHHTAEGKLNARDTGAYDIMDAPARGGFEGCFVAGQHVITMDGPVKIGRLCEKRLVGPVRTWDEDTSNWVYRPVTDWFTYDAKVTDIRNVHTYGPTGMFSLKGTVNHVVYTSAGPKLIGELTLADKLLTPGFLASVDQRSVLLGTLLGDASIHISQNERARFQIAHAITQSDYFFFKYDALGGLLGGWSSGRARTTFYRGKPVHSKKSLICNGNKFDIYSDLHKLCYSGPDATKVVTPEWLAQLDDLAVMIWLLDDGSIVSEGHRSERARKQRWIGQVATQGFRRSEVELLAQWLTNRYGHPATA